MVKKIKINNKKVYSCGICGLSYKDKSIAIECEIYCKEHNACSLEITKKAIKNG